MKELITDKIEATLQGIGLSIFNGSDIGIFSNNWMPERNHDYQQEYFMNDLNRAVKEVLLAKDSSITNKLTELKTNLEIARIAHNCATGITKKNIGISMTCTEYAISVLKELVE